MIIRGTLLSFTILLLVGCTKVTYSPYETNSSDPSILARHVFFKLKDKFYQNPPGCIAILATKSKYRTKAAQQIERSAALHLSGKVEKVVGPFQRIKLERNLGLDLSQASDRRTFSKQTRCHHFIQPELLQATEEYSVIWSDKVIKIRLIMHGISKDEIFWQASHRNLRGDGGLPLSPFSLGAAIYRAGQVHGDYDAVPSMIDDSMRRMLTTLPDTRY